METKTVSPRVGIFSFVFITSVIFLIIRHLLPRSAVPALWAPLWITQCVVLLNLSVFGMLAVRNRTRRAKRIEHLTGLNPGCRDRTAADFPIHIGYRSIFARASYAPVPNRILVWCMIPGAVLCLTVLGFPAPRSGSQILPSVVGLALLFFGSVIAIILDRSSICEVTSRGISTPTGFLAITTTFVPWEDVAVCEFVHDEGLAV